MTIPEAPGAGGGAPPARAPAGLAAAAVDAAWTGAPSSLAEPLLGRRKSGGGGPELPEARAHARRAPPMQRDPSRASRALQRFPCARGRPSRPVGACRQRPITAVPTRALSPTCHSRAAPADGRARPGRQDTGAAQSLAGGTVLGKFIAQMDLLAEATITPSGMDEQLRCAEAPGALQSGGPAGPARCHASRARGPARRPGARCGLAGRPGSPCRMPCKPGRRGQRICTRAGQQCCERRRGAEARAAAAVRTCRRTARFSCTPGTTGACRPTCWRRCSTTPSLRCGLPLPRGAPDASMQCGLPTRAPSLRGAALSGGGIGQKRAAWCPAARARLAATKVGKSASVIYTMSLILYFLHHGPWRPACVPSRPPARPARPPAAQPARRTANQAAVRAGRRVRRRCGRNEDERLVAQPGLRGARPRAHALGGPAQAGRAQCVRCPGPPLHVVGPPPRWRGRRGRTLWAASPAAARPRAGLARAGTAEGVATLLLARVFMHVRHEGGLPQVPAGGVIVDSAAPAVAQAPRSVAQVPRRPQGNGCPNPTRPQGGRDHGRRAAVL